MNANLFLDLIATTWLWEWLHSDDSFAPHEGVGISHWCECKGLAGLFGMKMVLFLNKTQSSWPNTVTSENCFSNASVKWPRRWVFSHCYSFQTTEKLQTRLNIQASGFWCIFHSHFKNIRDGENVCYLTLLQLFTSIGIIQWWSLCSSRVVQAFSGSMRAQINLRGLHLSRYCCINVSQCECVAALLHIHDCFKAAEEVAWYLMKTSAVRRLKN